MKKWKKTCIKDIGKSKVSYGEIQAQRFADMYGIYIFGEMLGIGLVLLLGVENNIVEYKTN